MTIRVVSYNILVQKFAEEPNKFIKCPTEFLQQNHRWNLIKSNLEKEITDHENTIICLQELSLTMMPKLELFFRQMNYTFFHNLYAGSVTDYMGVGLAIPTSMQLNALHIIKIGDHLRSMTKAREKATSIFTWGWNIYRSIMSKFIEYPPDPWNVAMRRSNTLIVVDVVLHSKQICIGTYHMPCLFKQPEIMKIHSSVVKDLMFQLANGHDFILAGDFNFKPYDECYHILTEINRNEFKLVESADFEIFYQPNRLQILKSAYREKNGVEPVYTNFAETSSSRRFCETLDYIFFNGDLTVEQVLELPDQPASESYPDETHPSDHLLIASTFRLS